MIRIHLTMLIDIHIEEYPENRAMLAYRILFSDDHKSNIIVYDITLSVDGYYILLSDYRKLKETIQ